MLHLALPRRVGYVSRLCPQPGHSLEFEGGTVSNLTALIAAPGACQQQYAPPRTTSTQPRGQALAQGQPQASAGAPWPVQSPGQAPAWPPGGGGVAVVTPEHPIAPPASGGVSVCPGAAEACQEVAATLRAGGSALVGVAASGECRCCRRRRRRRRRFSLLYIRPVEPQRLTCLGNAACHPPVPCCPRRGLATDRTSRAAA